MSASGSLAMPDGLGRSPRGRAREWSSSGDDTEKGEPRFFSVLPFINPTVRRAAPKLPSRAAH